MVKRNKTLAFLSITVLLLAGLFFVSGVRASDVEEQFTVDLGYYTLYSLKLDAGNYVNGTFTVFPTGIYFSINDPQENKILDYGLVNKSSTFSFTANVSGTYNLNFSNPLDLSLPSSATHSQMINLEVDTPQPDPIRIENEMLITIIVILIVAGVVTYAVVRNRKYWFKNRQSKQDDSRQP
jgi:hypothetical protein